jgi:hypothetical protein
VLQSPRILAFTRAIGVSELAVTGRGVGPDVGLRLGDGTAEPSLQPRAGPTESIVFPTDLGHHNEFLWRYPAPLSASFVMPNFWPLLRTA